MIPTFPAQRPFGDHRRVGAADGEPELRPIARALAHVEIQLRAEAVAVALRVRPFNSVMPSRMSPFSMAIEPPSWICWTVCRRNDVGTPST